MLLNAAGALVAAGLADDLADGLGLGAESDRLGRGARAASMRSSPSPPEDRPDGPLQRRASPRPVSARSPRSSGARPPPATCAPTPIPALIAPAYAAAGAAAISVLVDERFGGTWDDLRAARAATTAPLLAKGFFSTDEHLRTAKEAGADAALLLLRDLDDAETARLMQVAASLGPRHARRGARRRRARPRHRARRAGARRQRPRPLDLRDRPQGAARARGADSRRPDRDRRERDPDPRPGRRGRARGRRRRPRRLDADARGRSGREAARSSSRARSSRCAA